MKSKSKAASLLTQYAQNEGTYRDFSACVRDLAVQIIARSGITIHSVTCRAKAQKSLAGKLQKIGKNYKNLGEITDLAGVRIITYFSEDAERISDLLEEEFEIDRANSIDKRQSLEPNEFGYLSIHHVAMLPQRRITLPEYAKFKDLKVEIQTRSILQHAWAEIEHDLGYKTTIAVPKKLRRRISRIAGLLELADQEFQTIRADIGNYESSLPRLVVERPRSVDLDKSSLEAYAKVSKTSLELDRRIAESVGATLTKDAFVDYSIPRLNWLGFRSIAQVEEELSRNSESIFAFAHAFLRPREKGEPEKMYLGMALFYLAYVVIGRRSENEIEQFVREAIGVTPDDDFSGFSQYIKKTWKAVDEAQTSRGALTSKKSSFRRAKK